MNGQHPLLPGLSREESELIESIEHHLAHAVVALGELLEVAEAEEDSLLDGAAVQRHLRSSFYSLVRVRGWKDSAW